MVQRALALHRGGHLTEAEALYKSILKIDPQQFDALQLYGCLLTTRDPARAVAHFDRAIRLNSSRPSVFYNRAVAHAQLLQWERAIADYDHAIALDPMHVDSYRNRSVAEAELGRFEASLISSERVLSIDPNYAEAHYNRGLSLLALGRPGEAISSLDKAVEKKADYFEAHVTRANAYLELMRLDEALADYDRAVRINPGQPGARYNRATVLLMQGRFAEGFDEYEQRLLYGAALKERREFPQPMWTGASEELAGKTILVHCEQGLGDSIQFCRYSIHLARSGAEIWLEVQEPLVSLLAGVEGVSRVMVRRGPPPMTDLHCPVMSLPRLCRTRLETIPAAARYLRADTSKTSQWQARLPPADRPRVGLVWAGNRAHVHDASRSLALRTLIAHLPEGFHYVSLQKDVREADAETLRTHPNITDLSSELHDFSDTAALCSYLQLVISVDTSVAHLGGALGTDTRVLLPFRADWRWMVGRSDSPWYPSMRLYRQASPGDWQAALGQLRHDLFRWLERWRPRTPLGADSVRG